MFCVWLIPLAKSNNFPTQYLGIPVANIPHPINFPPNILRLIYFITLLSCILKIFKRALDFAESYKAVSNLFGFHLVSVWLKRFIIIYCYPCYYCLLCNEIWPYFWSHPCFTWDFLSPYYQGWRCSALLPKPLSYLWPKSVIFPTLSMTWPKIQNPIYDLS